MESNHKRKCGQFLEYLLNIYVVFLLGIIILFANIWFYINSEVKDDGKILSNEWMASFGESLGIAAAILSFFNILLIVYTVQKQNEYNKKQDIQNKNQDENQRKKVETLNRQVQLTAELSSLDIIVKTLNNRINLCRDKLDEISKQDKNSFELGRLHSEINKSESFAENLRHEISEKYNSLEFSNSKNLEQDSNKMADPEAKKPVGIWEILVKKIKSFWNLLLNNQTNSLNESGPEDSPKIDNSNAEIKEIKQKILQVCKEISIPEGIPECAIIPKDILNYLFNNHKDNDNEKEKKERLEKERLEFLKNQKSFFAKWINDCFIENDVEVILNDVKHYYKIERSMSSDGAGQFDYSLYKELCNFLQTNSKSFYGTISKIGSNYQYISNPYLHRSQVYQIARKDVKIQNQESLKNLKWYSDHNNSKFSVLSDLQYKQIGEALYKQIELHKNLDAVLEACRNNVSLQLNNLQVILNVKQGTMMEHLQSLGIKRKEDEGKGKRHREYYIYLSGSQNDPKISIESNLLNLDAVLNACLAQPERSGNNGKSYRLALSLAKYAKSLNVAEQVLLEHLRILGIKQDDEKVHDIWHNKYYISLIDLHGKPHISITHAPGK